MYVAFADGEPTRQEKVFAGEFLKDYPTKEL